MKVSVATMALGRMWRRMMVKCPTPSARAARTKSKLRARRNSARTTPTSAVQLNRSSRPSSHQKFGVTTLARMISRYRGRHRGPDLDEALEQQVDPAAEIALHRAGEHADHGAQEGQRQAEQDRDAKAVDHPGEHVARLIVGAEQVLPGRRRGRRPGQIEDHGVVAVADRRPQHPTPLLDQLGHERVGVVGLGREVAAEGRSPGRRSGTAGRCRRRSRSGTACRWR